MKITENHLGTIYDGIIHVYMHTYTYIHPYICIYMPHNVSGEPAQPMAGGDDFFCCCCCFCFVVVFV